MSITTKKENGKEVRVKEEARYYTDEKGRNMKETTTTTTTIGTDDGALSSTTKTEVQTECIGDKKEIQKIERDVVNYSKNYENFLEGIKNLKLTRKENAKMNDEQKSRFRDDCVLRHNELRRRHRAPPLTKNKKLEEKAQRWAEHLLDKKILQADDDNNVGQNIAYKYSSDFRKVTGSEITDMWYGEVYKYDFSQPEFSHATGHFTQLVWKNTIEIGVGVATDGEGTLFVVANYFPAGNYKGKFSRNVVSA